MILVTCIAVWQAGVYGGKMAADPDMLPGYDP